MDALGIANTALRMLSERAIASFDVDSTAARVCLLNFQPAIDEVTSEFEWTFARARAGLIRDADTPNYTEYSYAYTLPDDMITLLSLSTKSYLIEGSLVYTDETDPVALYIRRLTEVSDGVPRIVPGVIIPTFFETAVATRLAARINLSLTGKVEMVNAMQAEYQMALRKAQNFDAMQSPGILPEEQTEHWEEIQ